MHSSRSLLLAVLAACACAADPTGAGPAPGRTVDEVDPRIGTGGHGWWAGNSFVGATAPFGMVQAGPDGSLGGQGAMWDHCSGYHAEDDTVEAFSNTHLHGTGIPDLGAIGFMPRAGSFDPALTGGNYRSRFDKASERARPGYYAVDLIDGGVRVELTASEVAARHRYTLPGGAAGRVTVYVDVRHTLLMGLVTDGGIEVRDGGAEVRAWALNQNEFSTRFGGVPVHVAARFDPAPVSWGTWLGADHAAGVAERDGRKSGAWLEFDVPAGGGVDVRVGVSYVGTDAAAANLAAGLPEPTFDGTLAAAEARWEDELSSVRFEGGTPVRRRVMATSLYHAFLMPTRFSDANGRYLGFDRAVHEGGGRTAYTNFSLWDTYRTQHPLLALVKPGRQADMVASLLRMYEQGGYLPKWPLGNGDSCIMIGTPADIVIADTWLRGVRDFDVAKAWEAVMKTAATPVPDGAPSQGRKGVEEYVSLGWVAADRTDQSVSRTLEFAVADAALAGLARGLGKDADAAVLAGRAANWKNLWDANLKLFAPRNADGSWPPFDPLQDMVLGTSTAYTEGNANQYRWFVPHDVPALVTAFGSPEVFVHELAAFLEKGLAEHAAALAEPREPLWWMTNPPKQYWHGNEPCIHAAYLFAFAGRQDLTQEWVHRIADALYHDGPDGLPGNDDAGTLAAWYVFTALGFLPVPGTDLYVLGSPFFPRAEVRLADGTLVVEAPGAGATRPYVKSVTLDGEPLAGPTFPHARIARGGTLRFELSDSPRD